MAVIEGACEMKESRFIEFDKIGDTGKTEIWNILSKSSGFILGRIHWYGPWRQYCFSPSPGSVFNTTCMDDIQNKIEELMKDRRSEARRLRQSPPVARKGETR